MSSESGVKHDGGKHRPWLVVGGFPRALAEVSRVATFGADKYTDGGWQAVPNGRVRYTDAMIRHILEEARGIEQDPESLLLHAAHTAWNALARLELELRAIENEEGMGER